MIMLLLNGCYVHEDHVPFCRSLRALPFCRSIRALPYYRSLRALPFCRSLRALSYCRSLCALPYCRYYQSLPFWLSYFIFVRASSPTVLLKCVCISYCFISLYVIYIHVSMSCGNAFYHAFTH